MSLLFEQNLSHCLATALDDLSPGSTHVRLVGLQRADDAAVWSYAAEHALTIVSKDADFQQRSFVYGHPPKVVWIRRGNCSTDDIAAMLRINRDGVTAFLVDGFQSLLALA